MRIINIIFLITRHYPIVFDSTENYLRKLIAGGRAHDIYNIYPTGLPTWRPNVGCCSVLTEPKVNGVSTLQYNPVNYSECELRE